MKENIFRMRPRFMVHGPWRKSFSFYCCLWTVVYGLFFSAGCATIYNPATERKEQIFIDSFQEVQVGRGMALNIIKQGQAPLENPAKQLLVNRMGQRLVQVCDRRDIMYHFMILDSPDLNAFALPGGYIYIYNGLLSKIDESALAAILAHEIGHVTAKHAVKKMQSALGYELLMGLALAGFGNNNPEFASQISGVSNTVYDLLSRGYSRKDELLADKLAVKYLHLAGYDPFGLVRVFELLQKEAGPSGRVFEILSDHPRMQERIKKVKEEIEKLPKQAP